MGWFENQTKADHPDSLLLFFSMSEIDTNTIYFLLKRPGRDPVRDLQLERMRRRKEPRLRKGRRFVCKTWL